MAWEIEGRREGVLRLKIELDVNSVDQLGLAPQDEDEEITSIIEINTFIASAVLNSK
ncbi:MAG: hypothetical protein NLN64_02390 [Candidatus Thalassarchaeaceae archaeon]|nr:hypothetical protein [Candidatus Thalassarchaeaceae archaeon]